MRRRLALVLLAGCSLSAWAANRPATGPVAGTAALNVDELLERNLAARGGLEAWRRVQTMMWVGHVENAGEAGRRMPFVLDLKRPNLTRFEISSVQDRFTRIFDGSHGWKLRPGRGGAPEVQAFSPEEASFAQEEFVIDGPLLDHRAKGVSVALDGTEEMDGRKAYRLSLVLPSGASRRLWLDAQTFLETRYDRPSTSPLHPGATISVYYRDYASVDGLTLPMRIEHGSAPGLAVNKAPDSLVIDSVQVNPERQARLFAKPAGARQRHATVNIPAQRPTGSGGGTVPSQ